MSTTALHGSISAGVPVVVTFALNPIEVVVNVLGAETLGVAVGSGPTQYGRSIVTVREEKGIATLTITSDADGTYYVRIVEPYPPGLDTRAGSPATTANRHGSLTANTPLKITGLGNAKQVFLVIRSTNGGYGQYAFGNVIDSTDSAFPLRYRYGSEPEIEMPLGEDSIIIQASVEATYMISAYE